MSPTTKLIVNFEDPHIDVKVVRDEPGKRLFKLLALVDVVRADRDGYVALLKDALGARLGRQNVGLVRVARQNGHTQLD